MTDREKRYIARCVKRMIENGEDEIFAARVLIQLHQSKKF